MHLLLRDSEGFKICPTNVETAPTIDIPRSRSKAHRSAQVSYSQWKNFVEGRQADLNNLDDGIVTSWNRCIEMGVDPGPKRCWDFLPMDQMKPFCSALKRICSEVESTIYRAIRGKDLLMTFTDANGRVARTCGDPEILKHADKLNFGPGANWAENSVGTNAIGTSLATGRPMQVFGEEHFCRSHHCWSCTAAPIIDPHGTIWGCFDISGPTSSDHSKSLELVLQATKALEQRLCRLYCTELEGQLGSLVSSMFNTVMTGVLSVDESGWIISANSAAETLLGTPWESLRGRRAEDFLDFNEYVSKAKAVSRPSPIVINCKSSPELYVRGLNISSPNGNLNTIVSISEKQTSRQFAVQSQKKPEKHLPSQQDTPKEFDHIIHSCSSMRKTIQQAARASRTPSTILLRGESGTGKELFAKGIHKAGNRAENPFVAVNCGAFSEELVQSELFGYRAGSFTGATKQGRPGKFQKADKGILFLDEISEMPLSQQVKLLRALEEKAVVPVGGTTPQPVDVKIIAATNKDLHELVSKNLFREDLFYRLNVVGIDIPPIRERGEDVILLAEHHLDRLCREFDIPCKGISPEVKAVLTTYDWPGNARELVNCIEYAVNNISGNILKKEDLPPYLLERAKNNAPTPGTGGFHLKQREAEAIREALDFHDGNISKAAKALGIGRNTLYAKLDRHQINI